MTNLKNKLNIVIAELSKRGVKKLKEIEPSDITSTLTSYIKTDNDLKKWSWIIAIAQPFLTVLIKKISTRIVAELDELTKIEVL